MSSMNAAASSSAKRTVAYLVEKISQQPIHPFSINEMIKYTARTLNMDWLCTSANWLQKEMPIRLAHRLHDFNRLPHVVVSNPHIQEVYEIYCHSFEKLYNFGAIRRQVQEEAFSNMLIELVRSHSFVVNTMAQGVSELRVSHPDILLDHFLDRFFVTRIGNRVLAEHHLAHHQDFITESNKNPDFCGVINRHVHPAKIVDTAASKIRESSALAYGVCPEIKVVGDLEVEFPYIPDHIRYVIIELLKNSVRATIETYTNQREMPPITVSVFKGKSDVFIKICDQGGGIPPQILDEAWKYGFTTVNDFGSCDVNQSGMNSITSGMRGSVFNKLEIAGYGFGLPLSRLYTRYFGGDLDIKSMTGFGTDTYVLLPRLGNQRESEIMLHNQLRGNAQVYSTSSPYTCFSFSRDSSSSISNEGEGLKIDSTLEILKSTSSSSSSSPSAAAVLPMGPNDFLPFPLGR